MKPDDVVKATTFQSDGIPKKRPAVLLGKLPYFDDWLVCGISGKTHTVHEGFDILINQWHPDFRETGLAFDMLIRTGWINPFPEAQIEGVLGNISVETLNRLTDNLIRFLKQ